MLIAKITKVFVTPAQSMNFEVKVEWRYANSSGAYTVESESSMVDYTTGSLYSPVNIYFDEAIYPDVQIRVTPLDYLDCAPYTMIFSGTTTTTTTTALVQCYSYTGTAPNSDSAVDWVGCDGVSHTVILAPGDSIDVCAQEGTAQGQNMSMTRGDACNTI